MQDREPPDVRSLEVGISLNDLLIFHSSPFRVTEDESSTILNFLYLLYSLLQISMGRGKSLFQVFFDLRHCIE